jgi:hypothetical protein
MALIGSSFACGQDDTQAADHAALDRVLPRLPNGLSIDEVEDRLGEPRARSEVEESDEDEAEEVVLTYGLWQLVFDQRLFKRTRYYSTGHWPADRPVAPLDREIHGLPLGSSRAGIERKIGRTEAWQILDFKKRERIWYGNGRWKLSLHNGALAGKENTQ